jgi:hypothetical protein
LFIESHVSERSILYTVSAASNIALLVDFGGACDDLLALYVSFALSIIRVLLLATTAKT